MKVNGESIYGTTASPFEKQLEFGRATTKPGRIYLHVFNWPGDGTLKTPALSKPVKRVYLLAQPKVELKFTESTDGLSLQLPAQAPDTVATVIVVETKN
jgi:alpha-L-fucosidase